jgi:uncharacterized protein HemX
MQQRRKGKTNHKKHKKKKMLNLESHQGKVKYLLIALVVILIAVVYLVFYQVGRKVGENSSTVPISVKNEKNENLEEKQLRDLEKLRASQEENLKSPEEQFKELEGLRDQDAKPASLENLKMELAELEKLRNSN